MCVMHEAEPYGHLVLNGRPMTEAQAATACSVALPMYRKLFAELEAAGVPSVKDGTVFSRRMVRDEAIRAARAAGGEAGAEHGPKGAAHGSKGGRPRVETGDKKPPSEPPPSSSSSASSSSSETTKGTVELALDGNPPGRNGHDTLKTHQRRQEAIAVLAFLNEKTSRNYQPVKANVDLIVARLRDGATPEDLRAVVAKKAREWSGDPKMVEYLRPATLFNATKFAQYQGELGAA